MVATASSCSAILTRSAREPWRPISKTALVMHDLMRAVGFTKFQIHVNNRQVLRGLLERAELTDKAVPVLRRHIDKLAKDRPRKKVRRRDRRASRR